MTRFSIFMLASLAVLLFACGSESGEPAAAPVDAGSEPEADAAPQPEPEPDPAFELSLATDKLPVLQGTSASLEITVTRRNGFADAIEISAADLPGGVSVEALTIAAGEDGATLELSATAAAPHSLPTNVTIRGEAGELEAEEPLTVTVYGPPGSLDTSFAGGMRAY